MTQTSTSQLMTSTTRSLFCLLILFALFAAAGAGATARVAQAKSRIAVASGVRVRSTPSTSGEEVARLPIGTIVSELEQSAAKEKIGPSEDYWYRVSTADGKQGWVFGSFTAPFDPNRAAEIYQRIVGERLKIEKLNFFDLADLARFLAAATADVKDQRMLAELEFARLIALKRALGEVPVDYAEGSPYAAWIKANDASLVYSDPAAMNFVKSDLFWDLQKKHSSLPIAETIAWEAANNPLAGECEGYVPCHLASLNLTWGRYLSLYPRGPHTDEALTTLAEDLKGLVDLQKAESQPIAEVRAEGRKELTALRDAVAKVTSAKKNAVLDQLTKLSQYYR